MRDARGWRRVAVLVLALSLHLGVGLVGVIAYWWRTSAGLFSAGAPHPLDAWVQPAMVAWLAVLFVLLVLTAWPDPRQRFAVQLGLPCVVLAIWLAVVGLVGPYPVTLRAELRAGALTTTATDLAPGPQSLAIRNATGTSQGLV